jgi:hypothetical protein
MQLEVEDEQEISMIKQHTKSDNLNSRINLIYHTNSNYLTGNMNYVSLHQILTNIYDKLFKLNIRYTKSLSNKNCNVIIENLPLITYGVNHVKRQNIHLFFKKLTNIDKDWEFVRLENVKSEALELENLIFTDLQLFLSLYNYHQNKEKDSIIKNLIKFMYQPIDSIKTYYNDKSVLDEVKRVFEIQNKNEVFFYFFKF